MTYDVCFLFRGDIRHDTRLSNFAHTIVQAGKTCRVIQGAQHAESFIHNGAEVQSFANTKQGVRGFFDYWRISSRLASDIDAKVWWAAELYSLPIAARRAKATRGRSAYDAREIFAHLGALKHRPVVQSFWRFLENRYIRGIDAVITTGDLDADFLEKRYGVTRPHVVRNMPRFREVTADHRLHDQFSIPRSTPLCLYTGGLQDGRGIPMMLAMAEQIPEVGFVFVGSGPMESVIAEAQKRLSNVYAMPSVPNDQVLDIAASATLGFALIEPISLSYQYALPNKLFEYIMAGIPVIVSDLPQMKAVVDRYSVGRVVQAGSLREAIEATRQMLSAADSYQQCVSNCRIAAHELCWETESKLFMSFAKERMIL